MVENRIPCFRDRTVQHNNLKYIFDINCRHTVYNPINPKDILLISNKKQFATYVRVHVTNGEKNMRQ